MGLVRELEPKRRVRSLKLCKASLFLLALCLTFAVAANADTLYANGPNGGICDIQQCTVDAWTINFGYTVTDQFTLGTAATIQDLHFAFWLFPGDTLSSVDWSIGNNAFGNDIASGTASGSSLSQQFISSNQYGYNIQAVWITGLNVAVNPGSYWVTLANAAVPNGDPVYWDENNGPSAAQENSIGTIPSESFYVTGVTGSGSMVPEPSSILLFGSGILGLAGVLRRKLF
jgi:PEP-CTERM motif